MTTQASVESFLAQKTLAIASVSRTGKGFGNAVIWDLTGKGYEMHPVHTEVDEVGGFRCFRSISDLPKEVGGLVLVVPPDQTEKLVREVKDAGIQRVWMQQGAESAEAIRFCEENGIDVVHGECVMMFAQPTGVHRLQRWVNGIFGKLPSEN